MVIYQRSQAPFWELKRCQGEAHSTRPHSHAEWSVGVVTGGACEVTCRGTTAVIRAPALVWFSPDTVHRCRPQKTSDWAFQMLYWRAPGTEGAWGTLPLTHEGRDRWLGLLQAGPTAAWPEFWPTGEGPGPEPAVRWARADRQFKRLHGLAPVQYRTIHKVRLAQQLLRDGASPVDAALEAGFYDQSQFTRVFRAFTGTTPGRYARSNLYKTDRRTDG